MMIYVNYLLYIGTIFILLLYLVGKYREKFSKKYYSLFLGLLFVYITGSLIAFLRGISFGNSPELIHMDLFRSTIFLLWLAVAGLLSRVRDIRHIENLAIILALISAVGILSHKLFGGFGLLGDIIKPSTVQLYNLSFVGFFGFYLLANKRHKNIGRFIILASWGVAVLSLAKWNFFPVVIFPLLWIIIETKRINIKKRVILCIIIITILISVLFSFRDNIIRFASEGRWQTWRSYWYSRVVAGDLLEDGEIRSGGRFKVWNDLLQQFSKAPLLGIGFGARPTYLDVEDHNMFIFFLVRFGIPLFCIVAVLVAMLFIHMLRYQALGRMNRLILLVLFAYFFLSAAVGTSFGQILNGVTVGGITGIILNPRR